MLERLGRIIETHDIHPHIRRIFHESQAEDAYLEVSKQKVAGKIAIVVQ